MNRVVSLVVLIMGAISFRIAIANPVMQVQLPFYDGKAYYCTQNSNNTPTHQFDSTRYDLDFDMKVGDIVVAASNGVIRWGSNPSGFGTYAKVDHGNGYWTMYGHLSGYIAQDGDVVVAGQPIAYSGNTGNVYPIPTREKPSGGQHIHFGVHDNSGTGTSRSMEVYAFNQSSRNLGWFSTDGQSDFVCGAGTTGSKYESRPIGQVFSDYSCKSLIGGGVLCWKNNPTTCQDGQDHVWYHKDSEGTNVSESKPDTWQKCFQDSGQAADIFSYLEGGYGIGGPGPGTWTDATDSPIHNLPDFIVQKLWLVTPWGDEIYKYGMQESFDTKAQSKNIGDGNCVRGEIDTITGHFYLSHGYKEDVHSGNGAWRRIDSTTTQCNNLKQGDTHTETKNTVISQWITEPGIYNIVFCIDHPRDNYNNGGDHREKHESNNCSTEAVFEVTAHPTENHDARFVDFVTSDIHFRQAPYYVGDPARFGATVTNQGTVGSPADIRNSYSVQCPGTSLIYLTDYGTMASTLSAGASAFEENIGTVTLPNVAGTCTAYFCANSQGAVSESDEGNNCTGLSFTLHPRPAPKLVITKFQDESGCCTTNTGSRIKPNIWVRNDEPASPGANVTVIYHISSPVATGGAYIHIGYGSIESRELPPGGTDEDYMDGSWSIPKNSFWKNQWHTVRGCLKADGSTPVGDQNTEVCSYYTQFSKK